MEIVDQPKLPETNIPICCIGAGGIVTDAHLPAYQKAGFKVEAIFDIDVEKAGSVGRQFNIPIIAPSIAALLEKAKGRDMIFDLAIPASGVLGVLKQIPDGSAVLIQKPMGETLKEAEQILALSKKKNLTAAINFQLRTAPFVIAARNIIEQGAIGALYDIEVKVTTNTPWHLWDFLAAHPRLEILYHSIHYIDLIRSFWGTPIRVMAKTVGHPAKTLSSTRSTVILDYGTQKSARVTTNHDHDYGSKHQQSYIKWEGTKGAVYAKMGLLLDYPKGVSDVFEYIIKDENRAGNWKQKELKGSWFPDAFVGSMASLMRFREGSEAILPTALEDALETMKVVEWAYESSRELDTNEQ